MVVRERTDVELSGELEEIATSAAERLRALTGGDVRARGGPAAKGR
jgi:hypothetical protein